MSSNMNHLSTVGEANFGWHHLSKLKAGNWSYREVWVECLAIIRKSGKNWETLTNLMLI